MHVEELMEAERERQLLGLRSFDDVAVVCLEEKRLLMRAKQISLKQV